MAEINSLRIHILAVIMTLLLGAILFSSLWQRFAHPDLVIYHFEPGKVEQITEEERDRMTIRILMQDLEKDPKDMERTLLLIKKLMATGQWEAAEIYAQKAMENSDNPRETRPLYLMAYIRHNRKEDEQAAELLERALEKDENPSARYSLGILYIHYLGKPEKGAEHLRAGIESGRASPSLKAAMTEELEKFIKNVPLGKESGNAADGEKTSPAQ